MKSSKAKTNAPLMYIYLQFTHLQTIHLPLPSHFSIFKKCYTPSGKKRYCGALLKWTALGPPLCVSDVIWRHPYFSGFWCTLVGVVYLGWWVRSGCIFGHFHCHTRLRKVGMHDERYNARPLNPLYVAHNFTKAVDKRPDYQLNFAQFRYSWDWGTCPFYGGFCSSGAWLYTQTCKYIRDQMKCPQHRRWPLFRGVCKAGFHCIY